MLPKGEINMRKFDVKSSSKVTQNRIARDRVRIASLASGKVEFEPFAADLTNYPDVVRALREKQAPSLSKKQKR